MKSLSAMAVGLVTLLAKGGAFAQSGGPMNGSTGGAEGMVAYGWMGGYGGYWLPPLVVIAVIGVVVLFALQKRK